MLRPTILALILVGLYPMVWGLGAWSELQSGRPASFFWALHVGQALQGMVMVAAVIMAPHEPVGRRLAVWGALGLTWLATTAVLVGVAVALRDERITLDVGPLAAVSSAFAALSAALAFAERAVFGRRAAGGASVVGLCILLWSPLCLDAFVERHAAAGRGATVLGAATRHSPLVLTAGCLSGFDLFKQERLYARFRVAEELLRLPTPMQGAAALTKAAAWLCALALVVGQLRRVAAGRRSPSLTEGTTGT